jgi:kumamolisin
VQSLGLVVAAAAAVAFPSAASAREGVTEFGRAPSSQVLDLVVPLAADDAGLRRYAFAVSTPGSPLYGDYAPVRSLARWFGASASTGAAVVRYLRSVGARGVSEDSTRMFVNARMSVALAERTFATPLKRFRAIDGQHFVAPAAVAHGVAAGGSLPAALHGLALGVMGLDTQALVTESATARSAAGQPPSDYSHLSGTPSGCRGALRSSGFTPNQYRTAYGLDPLYSAGLDGTGETVAVVEIHGFKRSDISTFASCFGLRLPPITVHRVGAKGPIETGGEPTLDLELLDAVAPGLKEIQDYDTTSNSDAGLFRLFRAAVTAPNRAQLLSSSLGLCESDVRSALGRTGVAATDRIFQLAAASGMTVASGSGDLGSSDCSSDSGDPLHRLAADYPGSSPWVTSVGGTQFTLSAANTILSQTVWNDSSDQAAASGGGFSAIFSRPSYQDGVVTGAARAEPDISAMADIEPAYAIFCSTQEGCSPPGWQAAGGTSAATPVVVAGLALVDQDLQQHGQKDVGFVNPLLYSLGSNATTRAAVFDDVTVGSNDLGPNIPRSNHRPLGCCSAGAGFDEATGWGSLFFAPFDEQARAQLPG